MNGLLKLRKEMIITGLVPLKYLLFTILLSDIYKIESDGSVFAVSSIKIPDLYDYFSDFNSSKNSELDKALDSLADEGLIFFDEVNDGIIYVGEFRGRKLFTFEVKGSMFESAKEELENALKEYSKSKSIKDKSRSRYIREQVDKFVEQGIDKLGPSDFTDLHGYLYELYTGGEIYTIRNKIEYYQTNNMLKAYDRFTVFAILVEGTLHYGKYSKKGIPTLTNVAYHKDDIFKSLTRADSGSKEYMRDSETCGGDF